MATQKQIDANRENASKSTGPQSDAGKLAVSQNARRHGIFSRVAVLPSEPDEEYNAFAVPMRAELRPAGAVENLLADRVVSSAWRLRRVLAVEAGAYVLQSHLLDCERATRAANTAESAARNLVKEKRFTDDIDLLMGTTTEITEPATHAAALAEAGEARRAAATAFAATAAPGPRLADCYLRASERLHLLVRYERNLENSFFGALATLECRQAARLKTAARTAGNGEGEAASPEPPPD